MNVKINNTTALRIQPVKTQMAVISVVPVTMETNGLTSVSASQFTWHNSHWGDKRTKKQLTGSFRIRLITS